MIERVRKVRKFRAFSDWTCSSGLPSFKDVNLIYGLNGSGKSTLASLLRATVSDASWSSGLEVDVLDAGTSRRLKQADDPIWQSLRVFNRDYVLENLEFEEALGGSAQPLLVLGKENVDAAKPRKRCQDDIDDADKALPELNGAIKTLTTRKSNLLRDRARLISSELGTLGGRYDSRRYDATALTKVLDGDGSTATSSDIEKDLQVVGEKPLPPLDLPASVEFSAGDLIVRVRDALALAATSEAISEFVQHPDWQSWVESGLTLHADHETCIYCDGPVSPERKRALAAHFDASLRELQTVVSGLQSQIQQLRVQSAAASSGLPKATELFQGLNTEYKTALSAAKVQEVEFEKCLDWLDGLLVSKLGSLFTAQESGAEIGLSALSFKEVADVMVNPDRSREIRDCS